MSEGGDGASEARAGKDRFDRTWQPRLWALLVALVLIAGYVIAFIVSNTDEVDVNFLFASPRTSLIWVILLSVAIGLVAGVLLSQLYARRRRRQGSVQKMPTADDTRHGS